MSRVQAHPARSEARSLRAVELAALECLRVCSTHDGGSEPSLPMPVERWVRSPLGFDFAIEPISDLPGPILVKRNGVCEPQLKRIRVHPRVAQNPTVFRWIVAHEIGHGVLHRGDAALAAPPNYADPAFSYRHQLEREANWFAACLLMPSHHVLAEIVGVCDELRLEREAALEELLSSSARGTSLWKHTFLPRLAARFGVRRSAVLFRVSEMPVVDGRPMLDPQHLFRIGVPGR